MVDPDDLVHLSTHATGSPLGRAARLLLRLVVSLAGLGPRLLRRMCRVRRWTTTAQATPNAAEGAGPPTVRELHPDSESETETPPTAPCEASQVGIARQGRATPLCAEGCQDQAAPAATVLLHEDQEVSDFPAPGEGGNVAAKL